VSYVLCERLFIDKQLYCVGLIAKVIDRTKTMDDVYGAFYDFSCMLQTKVCIRYYISCV